MDFHQRFIFELWKRGCSIRKIVNAEDAAHDEAQRHEKEVSEYHAAVMEYIQEEQRERIGRKPSAAEALSQ